MEGPWMVIGDFNAFLHASEKKSRRPPQTSQVDAFREALEFVIFKILGLRVILLQGTIRDRGRQIQKLGWIEVWLMKLG